MPPDQGYWDDDGSRISLPTESPISQEAMNLMSEIKEDESLLQHNFSLCKSALDRTADLQKAADEYRQNAAEYKQKMNALEIKIKANMARLRDELIDDLSEEVAPGPSSSTDDIGRQI
jgi:flagellar motility protein MotE (MotC chaperone)